MRSTFARRPLRRRIIALGTAYAIALAGLIASFGAAQATAQAAAQAAFGAVAGGIICHSDAAEGGPATGSHESDGAICFKSCVGCMTSLATVIPPTVVAAGPPQLAFKRLDLPGHSPPIARAKLNAHRSRGPPPVL